MEGIVNIAQEPATSADSDFPRDARVVVIGGGVVGCSVAYHLAKRGWNDVVLLERRHLTSGTTWHAAGLIGQLRSSIVMSNLSKYSEELFLELERSTGSGTGYRRTGSLLVASSEERWTEVLRSTSMARLCGIDVQLLTPDEAGDLWPGLEVAGVVGAALLPGDGIANPTDVTQALARGARAGGVRILEQTEVKEVRHVSGRVAGVTTDGGDIDCDFVVNCTGMWAHAIGRQSGVTVPLHPAEHFYLITEPIPDLDPDLPVLRLPDDGAYVRVDAGKLMVGFFEHLAKPWATGGIPSDIEFVTLPEDWDHVAPLLERVARRLRVLEDVGIQLHFNGPESFTPDGRYILGEAPTPRGYFVAAGFNSGGLNSAGGAGRAVADWIVDGRAPIDLWEVDIRRFMPFQRNRRYLQERTREIPGAVYDMHWPFRQFHTARGIRRSPLHERLVAQNACFGEVAGWERPNWYAPAGVEPKYEYSYGRQNWFIHSAEEHHAVRRAVGLFDQTSFGKILVQGRDVERALGQICAADIDVEPGRIVYTQWLNDEGGIEADVTVTRLREDQFLVVTGGASIVRDIAWLRRRIAADDGVVVTDVTSGEAVIGLMGPRSRELLASKSDADLSNTAFPFGSVREIGIGMATVRAARITYVGELGYELYVPTEFATYVYDQILDGGVEFGLRHAGYHALNSLRIEKAYRQWGHDITDKDTVLEAGLEFAVAYDKPGGFIGREAILRQREAGPRRRLAAFVLDDPAPLLYGHEPIWRDDVLVGHITSGMFGHTVGRTIGLGYVRRDDAPVDGSWVANSQFDVEIATKRFPVRALLRAPYDPTNARIKT